MCILAVDFTIFPRKYAKTYLSGFSLVHPLSRSSLRRFALRELGLLVLGFARLLFLRCRRDASQ